MLNKYRLDPMMIAWWTLFALAIGTVVFIRIRLLAIPLERDEGEYAYAGQLMLQGIPPYKLAYNMKFPGIYAAYALMMALFGQAPVGIHIALLLVNLATVSLVFTIALRMTNIVGAIAAAAAYAIASASPSALGLAAHTEHFVLLPALGAILLLLDGRQIPRASRILTGGFLFGIAVLMKQPGIFFLIFGGCYLLYRELRERVNWRLAAGHAAIFVCGAVAPVALTFFGLWIAGVFPKAWFWTINYARAYGTIVPLREGMLIAADKTQKVLGPLWPLCGLGLLGFVALVSNERARKQTAFIALLLLGSAAALCSGLWFREHYYVFILPVLSLFLGIAVATSLETFNKWRRTTQSILIIAVAAALAYPMVNRSRLFFVLSPEEACTEIYRGNLFREAPRIGAYLREHTERDDTIAVIGSEPEVYFYSGRHSATGYIYTYALMEEHGYVQTMQEEMEHEIEQAQPRFLIYVPLFTSWFVASWSDLAIFYWVGNYASRNYHPAGFVKVLPDGATDYCLPCDRAIIAGPSSVIIFERNR